MSFTNRFGADPEATRNYVARLVALVGDREPLDVLCSTGALLRARTSGVDETRLAAAEAEGKWSALQVLQHLADSEFAFGFRIRMAIGQDEPHLAGFDQDSWSQRLRYGQHDAELFLAAFDATRSFNILLYRSFDAEDLERRAIHAERGPETVRHMLRLNAAHDLVHLAQIERILSN